MSHRFYLEQPPVDGRATLSTAEGLHLVQVMRVGVGEEVTLFDGSGKEYRASVTQASKKGVILAVLEERAVSRESTVSVTLGVALPRGDRQAWLVEKATELGVTRLIPLQTKRGVAQPTDQASERLRRGVIEASKQCGRNTLMQVAEAQSWSDFIRSNSSSAARLIAHPGTSAIEETFWQSRPAAGFVFGVGPEGGLTDEEVEQARAAAWQLGTLGPRILRIETAALLLAARVS